MGRGLSEQRELRRYFLTDAGLALCAKLFADFPPEGQVDIVNLRQHASRQPVPKRTVIVLTGRCTAQEGDP